MTEGANKLIVALREDAEWAQANEWETPITLSEHLDEAADLIESLFAQLEQVTNERDAAIEVLHKVIKATGVCFCCKSFGVEYVSNDCMDCIKHCNWQWRGAEVEG